MAGRPEGADQPQLTPPEGGAFTKSDGKPFKDQKAAGRFMRSKGLGQGDHDIIPRDGGYVVQPKAARDTTDDTALAEPDAPAAIEGPKDTQTQDAEIDDALPAYEETNDED